MKLKLDRPIIFFDLETTGLNTETDRIVSMCLIRINPDGSRDQKYRLINPGKPISPEAAAIHGITDDMVKDQPQFAQIAKSLYEDWFKGNDLAGFNNNHFDNNVLHSEFARCNITFPDMDTESLDVCAIYHQYEKRDLSAAVKFYCGREMENAHNAEADVLAAIDIFEQQMERYDDLKNLSLKEIGQISKGAKGSVDWAGKIMKDDKGEYRFTFGKHKGELVRKNLGFANWMLSKDFTAQTKMVLRDVMREIEIKTTRREYND